MSIVGTRLSDSDQPRRIVPGELLVHPVAIVSAVLLVGNDLYFKYWWPGMFTGKLSDFAGLIVCPLLFVSLAEYLRQARHQNVLRAFDAVLWPAITGIGFVLVKCVPACNDAYAWTVGAIRWPAHAFAATLDSEAIPQVHPILVSQDFSDLLALLALPLPYILIRTRYTKARMGY